MIEKNRRSRRGIATKYLAFGTAAALTLTGVALGMTVSSADEQTPPTDAVSTAHGQGLFLNVAGLNLAGTASARSAYDSADPGWEESQSAQLAVELLGLPVTLGTVTLPLLKDPDDPAAPGLLDLGSLDALIGTADSTSASRGVASSGVAGQGGSAVILNPNDVDASFSNATLDASALIEQVLGAPTRDALLDTAKIEIGAVGARADKTDGTLTRQYMLADLQAQVRSQLLADLVQTVHGTVDDLVDPIDQLAGPGGTLETALQGIVNDVDALPLVDASVGSASIDLSGLITTVNDELLLHPLQNVDQSISIDLNDGMVTIDLERLIVENHPTANTLSELDANTSALSGPVVNAILDGVTDALIGGGTNSLISKVVTAVTDGIYSASVNLSLSVGLSFDIGLTDIEVANGPISITTSIGTLLGETGYAPTNIDVTGVALLPGLPCIPIVGCLSDVLQVGTLLQPVVNLLTGLVSDLGGTVLSPVVDTVLPGLQQGLMDVVQPLVSTLLDDALEPVLTDVVQLTINEQPTDGDLGVGSKTVRALSLTLLPTIAPVSLELASATVLAAEPAAMIVATPESVASGETVTVAGSFFTPNTAVSITIPGVATPIPTTADTNGAFSTTWTVPAGFATGPVVLTATSSDNKVATDTVTVVEAALTADDAPQGGTVVLAGTGFVPGEAVTVASDLPGTAPTPTAAPDGSFAASWPVSATQTPGTFTFTATGAGGREAEDDAAVTLAVATLGAAPNPVMPGGTVTLTGGNFAPGEAVTLTLPASCAVTSGTPVVADGSGNFIVTCAVGASVADGTALNFSATGNDSGRSATAQTEVDSQPPADVNTNASASAAASAQANGNNEVAAQVAAQAAAMADQSSTADAAADPNAEAAAAAAARASVSAGASTNASATATTSANSAAQASANVSADSTASSNANATSAASAVGSVDARAASQAASDAAADGANASATASQDATANVRANANASASASASARANGDEEAAAQAAAQAAAYSAANSDASAAATPNANAAAQAAAYTAVDANVSANASTDVTTSANAAARAAAQASTSASAVAEAAADQNADSAADGSFDSRSAARSAAEASSAANASATASGGSAEAAVDAAANVQANANASASASASADADSHSNPNAQAAAQAAAFANNDSDANAAATPNAVAAAQAAARPSVDATASATASQNADSQAVAAAQSTATTSADVAQAAQATATATADAEASAAAAAISNASTDASQNAAADVNASASASASAQADSNANAAAQAAAETSALANASTTATASASAAATANALAAAQAAAQTAARTNVTAVASANASQETSAQANVAANVAAQATATTSATANTAASADTQAAATANSSSAAEAAARQAANVDSTADASASAAANARASVTASPSAQAASQGVANASGGQKLVNTGAAIGGITAAGLVLLLIGSIVLVSAQRRKNLV